MLIYKCFFSIHNLVLPTEDGLCGLGGNGFEIGNASGAPQKKSILISGKKRSYLNFLLKIICFGKFFTIFFKKKKKFPRYIYLDGLCGWMNL